MEYIPDPIELGEAKAEAWAKELFVGNKCRCIECKVLFELDELITLSPDPYAPPVCEECAEKLTGKWNKFTESMKTGD